MRPAKGGPKKYLLDGRGDIRNKNASAHCVSAGNGHWKGSEEATGLETYISKARHWPPAQDQCFVIQRGRPSAARLSRVIVVIEDSGKTVI